MRYSKHASKRSQQRALPEEVLNLVMALGEDFKSYRGTRIKALVSKFAKNEFLQELKLKGIKMKEHWCDTYLVYTPGGEVITVGYRYKKIRDRIT